MSTIEDLTNLSCGWRLEERGLTVREVVVLHKPTRRKSQHSSELQSSRRQVHVYIASEKDPTLFQVMGPLLLFCEVDRPVAVSKQ